MFHKGIVNRQSSIVEFLQDKITVDELSQLLQNYVTTQYTIIPFRSFNSVKVISLKVILFLTLPVGGIERENKDNLNC